MPDLMHTRRIARPTQAGLGLSVVSRFLLPESRRLRSVFLILGRHIHIAAGFAGIDKLAVSPLLEVVAGLTHFPGTTAEEDALAPFPGFNAREEEDGLDEDNAPLPRDTGVLENIMVEDLESMFSSGRDRSEGRDDELKENLQECRGLGIW